MEFWLESSIVRAGAFSSAAIRVPAARVAANNATGGRCPAMSVVTAEEHPSPPMVADRLAAAPVVAASSASGRRAGRYCQDLWMGVFQTTSATVDLMGASVLSALNRVKNRIKPAGWSVLLCHFAIR